MSEQTERHGIPPFPSGYRSSGVLLHVSSLPSPYGIGDVGPAARAWIDRLHEAGQGWWQALPLGPTGYGNSPYQSLSSFAGNEALVSPQDLIDEGLLGVGECEGRSFPAALVDYDAVIPFKIELLQSAWTKFSAGARADLRGDFAQFSQRQAHWLDDYALFKALKPRYRGACYLEWPAPLLERLPAALISARRELATEVEQVRFAQFLLFRQWQRLRDHAAEKGVRLIGDLPFYVSLDSSDVWANPQMFLLDAQHRPRFVAGVPPDYFSAQGQLWGNPVYDWAALQRSGYRWAIDRLGALLAQVDAVRLDHFRGFAAAWHVPAGAATAKAGQWVPGPGAEFFTAASRELGELPFIAEDLGLITPDVGALRDRFRLPGMRVLQFAFDGKSDNPHLPDNYAPDTVVYTATHDNATTRGWFEGLTDRQRRIVWDYLKWPGGTSDKAAWALIELAWTSSAALAMAPLQDLLNLGNEARMNFPGRADGNWRWRCTEDMLTPAAFQWLHDLTITSSRASHRLLTLPEKQGAIR